MIAMLIWSSAVQLIAYFMYKAPDVIEVISELVN